MSVNELLADLCDELAEGGVPEPLGERFTLAAVWLALCRLAGEEPPGFLLALLDGAATAVCDAA